MLPVIALVGRPNVGKSTLFNRLTQTQNALVADWPGLTRDRQYGHAMLAGRRFLLVDTGGLINSGIDAGTIDGLMQHQSWQAVEEADLVVFLVDAAGLNASDEHIARQLRRSGKPLLLVVNKIDSLDVVQVLSEFYGLGMGDPVGIAAVHGRGIGLLGEALRSYFPDQPSSTIAGEAGCDGMVFAVVGRPNVGKSTFINRLLGQQRLVVCDQPGTTRDSIYVPLNYDDEDITLVDTAGIRRRGKVHELAEKLSVIKTLQAVDSANVVIMMLDGSEGIVDQDASLLGHILTRGRALVLAVNKWDGLSTDKRRNVERQLAVKLRFTQFSRLHYISALHGSGIRDVLDCARRAYKAAFRRFGTPQLNRLLADITQEHAPPLSQGRRIKLRYIHQGGVNPPRFIIHGNQTSRVPDSYRRYLVNRIRELLKLEGAPVHIEFRGNDNPYADRRNVLTPRQLKKRARVRGRQGRR